jgi:hypothetical protein
VFGVFAVGIPEVKPSRVAERVHGKVDVDLVSAHHRANDAPVTLQLLAGRRLKTHGRATRTQRAFRPDVVADDRNLPGVALRLQLPKNHDRIPDALRQKLIDLGAIRIEHAPSRTSRRTGRAPARQRPTHRLRMHAQLPRDVTQVDTALHQCLNHHEVLLPEQPSSSGLATVEDILLGVWGTSYFGVLRTSTIGPDIGDDTTRCRPMRHASPLRTAPRAPASEGAGVRPYRGPPQARGVLGLALLTGELS